MSTHRRTRSNPRITKSLNEALETALVCLIEAKHYAKASKLSYTADMIEEASAAIKAALMAAYDEAT